MNLRVSAVTKAQDGITEKDMEQLKIHCGINAGISQCRETFLDGNVQDEEKARKRFDFTVKRGHMSIADHAMVEVVFEKASRMMAMVMNSLRFHATTEKSGRYTEMEGNDAGQCALYDKWNAIFKARVLELYPDYNDAFLEKQLAARGFPCMVKNGRPDREAEGLEKAMSEILAMPNLPSNTRSQENARYVLSIFTKSTAFGYTTSLAQWNYIYDWCMKYIVQFTEEAGGELLRVLWDGLDKRRATGFEKNLYADLKELAAFIKENLYVEHLRDHKKRCFSMLTNIAEIRHPMFYYDKDEDDHLGFSYSQSYEGSFILLSHLHRHRTIQYWMHLEEGAGFYVPQMIRGRKEEKEWLSDLEGIRHLYPQGMLVRITEAGTLDNFVLKATERLCGCAMLETMENVRDLAMKFACHAKENGSSVERQYVSMFYDFEEDKLKTKDKITDGCREGCYFGCGRALNRIV